MSQTPGTVSKILWHFPGGPKWNDATNCQDQSPKPQVEAFEALTNIIASRCLKLGSFAEVVKVIGVELTKWDTETQKVVWLKDQEVTISSKPVCCVADIPVAHLGYHSHRYGKMAIGFHRAAIVRNGFNPVLYTLDKASLVRTAHWALSQFESHYSFMIQMLLDRLIVELENMECNQVGQVSKGNALSICLDIQSSCSSKDFSLQQAFSGFRDLLAFIKTFNANEFDTIYCEREWRSVTPFSFSYDDIAMIVLPHTSDDQDYFREFLANHVTRLALPREIPIVPWEDLIEH